MGSRVGRVDKFFSPLLLSLTESINQIFSAFHPLPSPPRARKKRKREREGEKGRKGKVGSDFRFPESRVWVFFLLFCEGKAKKYCFCAPSMHFWGEKKTPVFVDHCAVCACLCEIRCFFHLWCIPPPLPLSKNILVFLLPNSLSVLFPAGAGGAAGLAARPPAAAAVRNGGGGFGFHPLNLQFPRPRS